MPDHQPALFSDEALNDGGVPVFGIAPEPEEGAAVAKVGEYNGSLVVRDPARYKEILRLSAEGFGIHRIARILRCSGHTVQMARDRDPEWIATLTREMAGNYRKIAGIAAEGLMEMLIDHPEKIGARDRAYIIGLMSERALAAEADAAALVTGSVPGSGHEGYQDLLGKLRAAGEAAAALAMDPTGKNTRDITDEVDTSPDPDGSPDEAPVAPVLDPVPSTDCLSGANS